PKNAGVKDVPSWLFVYYTPGILPPSRGFQTIYTDPIFLHVTPRESVKSSAVSGVRDILRTPSSMLTFPEASEAELRGSPTFSWPLPVILLVLLALVPPVSGAVVYYVWRRRHPNGRVALTQRHSRAAK